ncbi:MAG: TPM domain-containing protein [bacterium]
MVKLRLFLFSALVILQAAATAPAAGLPEIPADKKFIQDYAGIIPEQTRQQIGVIQKTAFESNDTPIIVVTIRSMADYGYAGSTIETFARDLFSKWQIGRRRMDKTFVNRGILLLVSMGDRKARIELGADWGHAWDGHCTHIMDAEIISEFKQGRFPEGILSGVIVLGTMAGAGPNASPPSQVVNRTKDFVEKVTGPGAVTTSPLPKYIILSMSALGIVLIAASFFFPVRRNALLIAGITLIAAAWLFWLVLVVAAMFLKWRGGGAGGGYSSGGGFGTGGFSGGGGASGSW